jgi:hypothetical protein
MKEKVIFDTNTIRNTEINTFFGGRNELELFVQDADIIIPFTVVEEIKRQKKAVLKSKKDSFISNPFHRLREVDEEETKLFDIDAYIEKLIDEETIPFHIIDVKNNEVLPQIKELALLKKAPFEPSDNTDKGFKDALIYFSVLEYLQEIPNKHVFVCAKDNLLGEAFKNNPNVFVVKDYNEFKQLSISQFFDDYFIEKVKEELGITITKENIKEYWYNINDNKVVLIEFEGEEYVIETDSGEIISSCTRSEFVDEIENLINAGSFRATHKIIKIVSQFVDFFSNEEILNILEAAFTNSEIRWIITDIDVKQFIGTLYESKKELITDDEIAAFFKATFE